MSEEQETQPSDRRRFMKQAPASLAIVSAQSKAKAELPVVDEPFFPEEFWQERMTPPEDGKRLGWFVDTRRCIGCHACEVSCKSENDVPLGNFIRQTFYKDVGEWVSGGEPVVRVVGGEVMPIRRNRLAVRVTLSVSVTQSRLSALSFGPDLIWPGHSRRKLR